MKLRFTKMQGAGNDFVVLDATRAPIDLSPAQFRCIADRRFGVGADQILIVGPSPGPGIDFSYRIVNADGSEVEQCGNGARCFVRYVREAGLTDKDVIRVRTASGVIEPRWLGAAPEPGAAGLVEVDMGPPRLAPEEIPFDPAGLPVREVGDAPLWSLDVAGRRVELSVVSMGNPHAVIDLAQFGPPGPGHDPVAELGPLIESHPRFARRVNAGFMQLLSDTHIALRVHERGAGETLACGTGACAAVVAGIRQGRLRAGAPIEVDMRGGRLVVRWDGDAHAAVLMSGPAEHVFDGEIELPASCR